MSTPSTGSEKAESVGGYVLGELIGEGGFARVYRATRGGDVFALKRLTSEDATATARFEREAKILRAIKHPNLIELVDHGVDEASGPYLVTRLVVGMTLRDLAAGRPIPSEAAILLVEPVLRALGAMHSVGLVHRDVKPENIMVTTLGEVVLVDLGLALYDAHSRLTEAGSVTGSVPYMAPEQIEGGEVDGSADVWGLGVVLYELVAGARPFARARPGEEIAAILGARPTPLSELDRATPPELERWMERALAADRSERFADASAALDGLLECVDWCTPKQMKAERRAVVTDPHRYRERVEEHRVRALQSEAEGMIDAGDAFAALRVLDRALAYRPDDAATLALVDRAGEAPEPGRAATAVATARVERSAPRGRWPLAVGIVLAIASSMGIGGWIVHRFESAPAPIAAHKSFSTPPSEVPPYAADDPADDDTPPPASARVPEPSDLAEVVPIPLVALSNDDEGAGLPRLRPGDPLVDPSLLGPLGPAGALESLDRQLRERPERIELNVSRALAMLALGRDDEGLALLDAVQRDHPRLGIAWGARGYVEYRRGHAEAAERAMTRAVELDPSDASSWRNRGILRSKTGRTRDAYEDLTQALRHDPDDVEALSEVARIYDHAGRLHDALPIVERIVRLRPRHVDAWIDLSMAQTDPGRAEASLRRALELSPGNPRALQRLCRTLAQHDARRAIDACGDAIEAAPRDYSSYMHRGLAYYHRGRVADALADLDRAVALAPEETTALTNRAIVREHDGRMDEARSDLSRACELGHAAACNELRTR
ncbi:MAG: tetratricopeptide repeat protein [Sandaracinaceae bacterium]